LKFVGTILNLVFFVPLERINAVYSYFAFRYEEPERSKFCDYFALQFSRATQQETEIFKDFGKMQSDFYNNFLSIESMIENLNLKDNPPPDNVTDVNTIDLISNSKGNNNKA
jgi:hypothetical protein